MSGNISRILVRRSHSQRRINVLYAAGLRSGSVGDAQRFFELSREELAEFSCVCGGSINNNEMAERIERIAARSAT